MKMFSPFRRALFAVWFPLAALASASAQTASPTATASPATQPAAGTAAASPTATVNAPAPAETKPPVRKDILDKYDKNHDGVLDADERAAYEKDRAARKAERLQKYDKNHDGKLDESELAAMRADRAREKAAAEKNKPSPTP